MQLAQVQPEGTSTRRHTIGLMPSNHTLTCTIAFVSAADGARFSVGRGGFGRRVIQKDYCHTSARPEHPPSLRANKLKLLSEFPGPPQAEYLRFDQYLVQGSIRAWLKSKPIAVPHAVVIGVPPHSV